MSSGAGGGYSLSVSASQQTEQSNGQGGAGSVGGNVNVNAGPQAPSSSIGPLLGGISMPMLLIGAAVLVLAIALFTRKN